MNHKQPALHQGIEPAQLDLPLVKSEIIGRDLSTAWGEAVVQLQLRPSGSGFYIAKCPLCQYATLSAKPFSNRIYLQCFGGCDPASIASAGRISLALPAKNNSAERADSATRLFARADCGQDSLVQDYLESRGIQFSFSSSIRFLRAQRNWITATFHPAMVARVDQVDPANKMALGQSGVHLTFLTKDPGTGRVSKAVREPAKLSLGKIKGGGVWLSPLEAIETDLAVAEGIETAASVQQLTGIPTVACLSTTGLRSFRWPSGIERLWIAADNDQPGIEAATVLAYRARAAGVDTHIKLPTGGYNDFNDLLQSKKSHE